MNFPECEVCGREPMAYDELCEHPQPIETKPLDAKAEFSAYLDEHRELCEGYILVDAGMDSEKKVPCELCEIPEPDRDGEDR